MAGFSPDEGLNYLGNVIYKGGTQEDLTLGLFTDSDLDTSSVWADVTEPSGTGYAEISLVQGTFTVSAAGVVTYPQQIWTASDDWSPGDIYGYYVRNNNATPKLLHVQYRDDGVFTMSTGRLYTVDLGIDTT
jgi:hypothetical protein